MNESNQLSAGQKAVVDAYLKNYEPAEVYDPDKHILVDTQTIMIEMNSI